MLEMVDISNVDLKVVAVEEDLMMILVNHKLTQHSLVVEVEVVQAAQPVLVEMLEQELRKDQTVLLVVLVVQIILLEGLVVREEILMKVVQKVEMVVVVLSRVLMVVQKQEKMVQVEV